MRCDSGGIGNVLWICDRKMGSGELTFSNHERDIDTFFFFGWVKGK